MPASTKENVSQFVVLNNGAINEFHYSLVIKESEDAIAYAINGFVDNFSVRQSLLRYSMSIELSIRDGAQLVDKSILKAGSVLELSLFKNVDDPEHLKLVKTFYVTNIDSSVQALTPNERVYDVTAFTFSGISDAWPFTSYYPSGSNPSDIIEDIVRKKFTLKPEQIGWSKGVNKAHWSKSDHVLDTATIFKQTSPFDAITNMLKRCTRNSKDSTFFFYEDIEGYKLRTIGDMTSSQEVIKYTMRADKTLIGNYRDDFYKILYLTQHNNSDYFKLLENGVYASEVVYIDLLNRTIGNNNSQNLFEYANTQHRDALLTTGEYDSFDSNTDVFKRNGVPDPAAARLKDSYDITPSTKISFSETAWGRKDYVHEKYPYDMAQRALFEQNKISIEVYGNPELKPGDMLEVVIPKQTQELGYSNRLNGKYLITAVRHNVKGNIFQTIVDLHKDSYEKDVLTESKDNNNTLT